MSDDLDSLTDTTLNKTLSALLPVPEHRWVETTNADECSRCGLARWQDERPCQIGWSWSNHEVMELLKATKRPWNMDYDPAARVPEEGFQVYLHFPDARTPEARMLAGHGATLARAGTIVMIRALRAELAALAKLKGVALCGRCGAEMRPNVPRLGWTAGAVHAASGRLTCADQPVDPVTNYTAP